MGLTGTPIAECTFPAEPAAVGGARRAVRAALEAAGGRHLLEAAELVTSELVTNSLVHAGTHVSLRITAEPTAVRVEVVDGSTHTPARRGWADTAGTGRGLLIVEAFADRWGTASTAAGKVVWFEIGNPTFPLVIEDQAPHRGETVEVTLLDAPILMAWAWQEHAATLLREFLLCVLEEDAEVIGQHAAASDALSLLNEQFPKPDLPDDLAVVMATLVEPGVTADSISIHVPASSVDHFTMLDDLLSRAVVAARQGHLLGAPTQPEVVEMRKWICGEVVRQARGQQPTSWQVRSKVVTGEESYGWLGLRDAMRDVNEAMIATSDSSIIVAVSQKALALLGYDDAADLIGHRVLVVIPDRYHQAHIAGTTLHVANGRDMLIGQWLPVPLVRADGSEVEVDMRVELGRYGDEQGFFIAYFRV